MAHQFEKHCSIYSYLKEDFERMKHPFNFGFYRSFKEGESFRGGDIIEQKGYYYLVNGRCALFAAGRKGYRFYGENLKLGVERQCCCGKAEPKKKCFYHSGSFKEDFLVFDDTVFTKLTSLPLMEQNPAVNKFLLKNIEEPHWALSLLINEYQNKGKHFEEYFSFLSSERKGRLVENLNSLGNRNNAKIDSFIRRQGFNISSLDYLILYKENGEDFIKYFTSKCDSEKRIILSNIMDSDFINEKVVDWLNEHYANLVSEARSSR